VHQISNQNSARFDKFSVTQPNMVLLLKIDNKDKKRSKFGSDWSVPG